MTRCNVVDVTRRSPSYEARLVKYALRGFEVFVQFLERRRLCKEVSNFSQTISLRPSILTLLLMVQLATLRFSDTLGLARLLALEMIYREFRGQLSGYQIIRRDYLEVHGILSEAVHSNDYEPYAVAIPWNPETTARDVERLLKAQVSCILVFILQNENGR